MYKLTKNFYYDEATYSDTAIKHSIENMPSASDWKRIQYTAECMENIRSILNDNIITVTSWYRNFEVNRLVGGSSTSNHMIGTAVDFKCRGFGTPARCTLKILVKNFSFNQLILYKTRLHIDFAREHKNETLLFLNNGNYRAIDIEDVQNLIIKGYDK
jgi:hypothetical protein